MKWAMGCVIALTVASAAMADAIDEAEAKRRGVSVERVQLERALERASVLEKKLKEAASREADLKRQLASSKEEIWSLHVALQKYKPAPPSTTQSSPAPADDRVFDVGEVRITVGLPVVGKLPVKAMGKVTTTAEDVLYIKVTLANRSDTKKARYESFRGDDFGLKTSVARLTDDKGNEYVRKAGGFAMELIDAFEGSIYPRESASDVLVFEKPVSAATTLKLELPLSNIGGTGTKTIRMKAP